MECLRLTWVGAEEQPGQAGGLFLLHHADASQSSSNMATTVSEAVQSKRSEDILGQKVRWETACKPVGYPRSWAEAAFLPWRRMCGSQTDLALATLATRTAAGLGIGVVLSALLFKSELLDLRDGFWSHSDPPACLGFPQTGRTGPIYFLTGAGFGRWLPCTMHRTARAHRLHCRSSRCRLRRCSANLQPSCNSRLAFTSHPPLSRLCSRVHTVYCAQQDTK